MLDLVEGRIERVRQIMSEYNLNVSQFAKIIGVSQSNLSAMLNGNRIIGDGIVNKICISFDNIDRDWLLEGMGRMFKSDKLPVNPSSNKAVVDYNEIIQSQQRTIETLSQTIVSQQRMIEDMYSKKDTAGIA